MPPHHTLLASENAPVNRVLASPAMDGLFAAFTMDTLADIDGTDVASGPGTVLWRTWPDDQHQRIDVLWDTFADKPAARTALLVGVALADGNVTGLLVLLETAGKREDTQRCIPLSRLRCLRHGDRTLHGDDHVNAMTRLFLMDAAARWLHSTAKDAKIIDRHAETFAQLATRLQADEAMRADVLLACVQAAKDAATAQSRVDALSG